MQSCEYCRGYVVKVYNDLSKAYCSKCGELLGMLKSKPIWHRRKWIIHKEGLLCTSPNWAPSKESWDKYYNYAIDKSDEWEERTL